MDWAIWSVKKRLSRSLTEIPEGRGNRFVLCIIQREEGRPENGSEEGQIWVQPEEEAASQVELAEGGGVRSPMGVTPAGAPPTAWCQRRAPLILQPHRKLSSVTVRLS